MIDEEELDGGAAGGARHGPAARGASKAPAPLFSAAFGAELLELFRWRRDVRGFRPDPLPEGMFERLVEIAALAPSVGLSQPWRFVSVEDPGRRAAVRRSFAACNAQALRAQPEGRAALYARLKLEGLREAPVQFALFCDADTAQGHGLGRRTMPETAAYSAVIALHTLWLAARTEGIGLGWISILDPDAVRRALDVPPGWRFLGYFCLGFPAREDDRPALERAGWERRRDGAATILRR